MEKLLRRSILNRNQLVNKKRRESAKELRKEWREFADMNKRQSHELNNMAKIERMARREDWIMGPLAPRRDVGMKRETFGAVDNVMAQAPKLPKRLLVGPKGYGYDAEGTEDKRQPGFEDGEWRGTGLRGNLCTDDRVVVIKGRPGVKGRIGIVQRIESGSDMVFIKGVNKVDLKIPPQAISSAGGERIFEQELPVHVDDIRLVVKEFNNETQSYRDVIVRQVYGGWPYQQRNDGSNLPRHTRWYLLNSDNKTEKQEIPWPKEDLASFHAQIGDTTRKLVEEVTYQPYMQDSPILPPGVIDELREKHSRTRRDWDDVDLMRRKMLEDARRDWYQEKSKIISEPFWTKQYLLRQKKAAQKENSGADAE